jgi:hypothetical protein
LAGGYVGYKTVPQESLRSWSNTGAASRAQVNQFASAAWEHLASFRIQLVPYNPNVLYSNPVPVKIRRVPEPAKNGPFEASPVLKDSNYHPDVVARRQMQWRQHFRNELAHAEAAELGFGLRIPPQKAHFNSHGQSIFSDGSRFITRDIGSDPSHSSHNGGVWKMFDSRGNRLGTFDENLNPIGP